MVILSAVFSQLRGDELAEAQGGSAQVRPCLRCRLCDCHAVCAAILQTVPRLFAPPYPTHLTLPHPTLPRPLLVQAFKRSTTKYWVRTSDVSTVKRTIIENMPVFVFNKVCAVLASVFWIVLIQGTIIENMPAFMFQGGLICAADVVYWGLLIADRMNVPSSRGCPPWAGWR